jgi:hypothetical protein
VTSARNSTRMSAWNSPRKPQQTPHVPSRTRNYNTFLPSVVSYAGPSEAMRSYMAGRITSAEYFERIARQCREGRNG